MLTIGQLHLLAHSSPMGLLMFHLGPQIMEQPIQQHLQVAKGKQSFWIAYVKKRSVKQK